jgi:hypothetical protein
VRADGKDIPPFVIKSQVGNASRASGRRPKPGEKPVRGMNKELMMEYADHIAPYVSEPSLLLLDRASSHTSKEVLAYIEDFLTADDQQLIKPILLPPKTAFLVSPLDNGVNSAFKQHFYQYDRSSFALKFSAIKEAWGSVSNESISNIFRNCGLTGVETLATIRKRFEKDVHGMVPEKLLPSLELYEQWISGTILVPGADLLRGVELKRPSQLEGVTLDGIKWIEWGG